jgi:hypothetical protein
MPSNHSASAPSQGGGSDKTAAFALGILDLKWECADVTNSRLANDSSDTHA